MILLKIIKKIGHIFCSIGEKHAFAVCLSNACKGMPNSQLEVAKYYFETDKNYVEAYAWADVASCNRTANKLDVELIKESAAELLKPEQMTKALDWAKKYKKYHLPKYCR